MAIVNILLPLLKPRTWIDAFLSFINEALLGHTRVYLCTLCGGFHITGQE